MFLFTYENEMHTQHLDDRNEACDDLISLMKALDSTVAVC
jgi:hypothetical protein